MVVEEIVRLIKTFEKTLITNCQKIQQCANCWKVMEIDKILVLLTSNVITTETVEVSE